MYQIGVHKIQIAASAQRRYGKPISSVFRLIARFAYAACFVDRASATMVAFVVPAAAGRFNSRVSRNLTPKAFSESLYLV